MTSLQPVKNATIKINYTRLPWIAGSSRNHMIRNYPTTSQETFNDGYKNKYTLLVPVNGWNCYPQSYPNCAIFLEGAKLSSTDNNFMTFLFDFERFNESRVTTFFKANSYEPFIAILGILIMWLKKI